MKVLLVHGIGQEEFTRLDLLEKWLGTIKGVLPEVDSFCNFEMAFYAKELFEFTRFNGGEYVAMGGCENVDKGFYDFSSTFFDEYVKAFNLQKEFGRFSLENDAQSVQAMDNILQRNIVKFIRFLEEMVSIEAGLNAAKFLKQAHTYLTKPEASKKIDSIVNECLLDKPNVIIAHSLGTVVAFKLLREMTVRNEQDKIDLFVTLGSPLSTYAVKSHLGLPRKKPDVVTKWVNYFDRSDFVSLGRGLTENSFSNGIDNEMVDNKSLGCHDAVDYLSHDGLITLLKETIYSNKSD